MKKICSLILFFVLALVLRAQNIDEIVAIVGTEMVLKSEVESQYLQFLSQGNFKDENIKCEIIEDILFQKLLINQAKMDSIQISDEEINNEIINRLNYFERQLGSISKIEEYFGKSKQDIESELFRVINEQFLAQKVQNSITSNINITPSEVLDYYNNQNINDIPFISEQLEISQLVIKPKFSDNEKEIIRSRLNSFRERVYNGEDFKMLATLYSDDIGSASKGGELGFVNRGDLVPEFERAAFKLDINEISEVIETDYGLHIIQMIERRGEQINVRHILLKMKVSSTEMYNTRSRIQEILNEINSDEISFDEAVEKYSEHDSKNNRGIILNPVNMSTIYSIDDLDPSLKVVVDKMSTNDVSKPFIMKLDDDTEAYRIIRLNKKINAHRANLTDDFAIIKDLAINLKKQEKQLIWIDKILKETYVKINSNIDSCNYKNKWIK